MAHGGYQSISLMMMMVKYFDKDDQSKVKVGEKFLF